MGKGPETILITGGYGFIGRNIIRHFRDRPFRLVIVDPGNDTGITGGEDLIQYKTDMSDPALLRDIVRKEGPDYVLHLAGLVTASREGYELETMIAANSTPLINLLKALKSADRLRLFVNFGSAEEYGPIGTPYTEDLRERPQSPYALAKLHNTRITTFFADQEGLPALTLRPGMVYGPHQPADKFLPSVILSAFKGESIVMTPGLQTRDLIYVEDLARIVEMFLKHSFDRYGDVYNAATGTETSLKGLVELVLEIMGSESGIETTLNYREKESMRFVCDMSNTREIIGSDFPYTSLEESLNKTITYYRELIRE